MILDAGGKENVTREGLNLQPAVKSRYVAVSNYVAFSCVLYVRIARYSGGLFSSCSQRLGGGVTRT
jgi:hypothetical protein